MHDDGISRTAQAVAAHRAALPRVPTPFGRPDDDLRLQRDVAAEVEVEDSPMRRYLAARTAFFDRAVVAAIDDGLAQLAVIAAGYDGRSLRYARDDVRWFELDLPATQADKRQRLARLGIDVDGIGFAPADLATDDAGDALVNAGLDPSRRTLFACEGLAIYLLPDVLALLLASIRRAAAVGSRLVIEVGLEPRSEEARARRDRTRGRVSAVGEPLQGELPWDDAAAMLTSAGWSITDAVDARGAAIASSDAASALVTADAT